MDPATTVRFVLNGRSVTVGNVAPTTTVLEYLRNVACCTGTKEGCAEGDCGACTVVLGELVPDGHHIEYRAINACIRLLPSIDGRELVTVEHLRGPDGQTHPVQQAMIDHHGSQCGFCTPGFVMSLFALYLQAPPYTRERVLTAVSGNLCRCTGYRPIIEAGCSLGEYPQPRHLGYESVRDPARCQALRALVRRTSLRMPGWYAPLDLEEFAQALESEPHSLILAGGTDVGLWITKELRELPPILYIGEVAQLREIRREPQGLWLGAAVSLTDAWARISLEWPELAELAQRFGSPPVRNAGTLCGNLANGSPIGDSMPALIALGAQLELRRGSRTRHLPLEDFYLGYQRRDLAPGEFITGVTVPARTEGMQVAGYKVSKRFDQDISAVCAVFALQLQAGTVLAARLAFGGMAATPSRARMAEQRLIGASWDEAAVRGAVDALAQDFRPLTDLRASDQYRLRSAGNLLRRFYLQTQGSGVALRTADALAAVE
jgi:xanthine dehydrogenase small subunit